MTAGERAQRTRTADTLARTAYGDLGGPDVGVALVAVGGYGRGELAPHSDLDLVLVHEREVGELGERLWYPLWDAGHQLDHAIRTPDQMTAMAADDLKVALGLLDARHVAGDPNLTLRLRSQLLTTWRRDARARLPELKALVRHRHARLGELAHASVPDLKEAEGGLRDAGVLKALVATWLVDVPHADLERCRVQLLDVRDVVQGQAGRATDRIAPEAWDALGEAMGWDDPQRQVRELGRRVTHLSRLTWRRADGILEAPSRVRRPRLDRLAPGIALSKGEVVLTNEATPDRSPGLLLEAAALAAEHDVHLAPPTAARLVRECPPLPEPWSTSARQSLVRLLASGRSLLPVWETLEETGALMRILPEWEGIRLLPHASPIHRFTVDRHVVETCIEASALIRSVSRPDVLLVAALLHDIGKGGLTEHSIAGEPLATTIATRMGFDPDSVALVARLVRWHLLLAQTATTRDPDDPATIEALTTRLRSAETAELLVALTEADARATSPKAWTSWRSGLIRTLGERVLTTLGPGPTPDAPGAPYLPVPEEVRRGQTVLRLERHDDGVRVTALAPDRVGLLADLAAAFAYLRVPVRGARAWTQDGAAVSVWEVADPYLDAAVLRGRFEAIREGRVDAHARLRRLLGDTLAPSVAVRPEASREATVIEVRAADRPGVLYAVLHVVAALDLTVRSAHVDTVGPQAVDAFYLQETDAGALSDTRAAQAAHAIRTALGG
jgi:[protein-PII] uridylyltransferase